MGEQSHKEAMREAIRGDLERARSRNPSIFEGAGPTPAPADEPAGNAVLPETTGPEPVVEPVGQPEPEAEAAVEVEPEPDPVAPAEPEPVVAEPEPEPEPDPEPRRGFLTRLAFWRR